MVLYGHQHTERTRMLCPFQSVLYKYWTLKNCFQRHRDTNYRMDQGPCYVPYLDIGSGSSGCKDCEGMKPIVQKKELDNITPCIFLAKNITTLDKPWWVFGWRILHVGIRTREWLCWVVLDLVLRCQLSCINNGMLKVNIRVEF